MVYYSVLLPWIIYFFLERIFFEKNNKLLVLPVIFLFLSLSFLSVNDYKIAEIFIFLYLVFVHLYFLRNTYGQIKILVSFWYGLLFLFYLYAENKVNFEFFLPLTLMTLLFRPYKRVLDFVFWVILVFFNFLVSVIFPAYLPFSVSLFAFFFLNLIVKRFLIKTQKEKIRYKNLIERALQTEVQNKITQAESHLNIANKKLKTLFKISNYTVSTTDLNLMAERIIEGLLNVGYTGVAVYMDKKGILKKEGYFPNFKKIEDDIKSGKWKEYKRSYINDDERFLIIPLQVGKDKFGFLAVYKKDGIPTKEVEYLSSYANSVAIAVANINYFEEVIRLTALTYKVFENLDIGIAVVNERLEIEMLNKAFRQMLNVKGKIINLIDAFPEIEYMIKDILNVKDFLKPYETEFSSILKKEKTFRIKVLPLKTEGIENPKIVILLEDITEKEKLELQIIEAEKLAVIGKMTAGLSHDIRTPLSVIETASQMLIKLLNPEGKIQDYINRIRSSVSKAEKMIDRLLNYSKPSFWEITTVNLKKTIEEAVDFAKHSISSRSKKKKHINIKTNLNEDLFVDGDKTAIQQVFINLLINAFEAIEDTGEIEISLSKEGNYAKVIIKDTGIGISEENLSKIFDPFYTTKETGTGLGLAVVKKILDYHRGIISVKSKKGQGTIFIIKFPLSNS